MVSGIVSSKYQGLSFCLFFAGHGARAVVVASLVRLLRQWWVTGHWSLVSGFWLLAVDSQPLANSQRTGGQPISANQPISLSGGQPISAQRIGGQPISANQPISQSTSGHVDIGLLKTPYPLPLTPYPLLVYVAPHHLLPHFVSLT